MGKLAKRERIGRNYPDPKPKYSSGGLIVGSVTPNLINSIYLPLWHELAAKSMEEYLILQIEYDEAVKEAEISPDGNVTIPPEPKKPVFHSQYLIDDFKETLEETSKHFSTLNNWKVHANAAKFERRLDEKYGIFRPFITNHPEVETFVRGVQRKWAMGYFSPLRPGGPPIARSTSVILLFMMQRNKVGWQVMTLATLFLLIGLQPWALVVVVTIFHRLLEKRRKKVMGKMDSPDIAIIEPYYKDSLKKEEKLFENVGERLTADSVLDASEYDTMILGGGPSALYTAALLSRAGRKVLLLSQTEDASGCLTLEYCKDSTNTEKRFRNVPFDIDANNISRVGRQQELLVPALCTTTDYQGGIRFAQIGTQADGYAFEILSIPGMGASKSDEEIPFVLRANGGLQGLMDDTARFLGDGWPGHDGDVGSSLSGSYVGACYSMNGTASEFYLSKVMPDNANNLRAKSTYQEASVRHASNFLDQCFPLNAHVRSLFAGMGMKGENLKPSQTSMGAALTNVCAAVTGEGMHYPVGGPRALSHALATVVEQCGGKILTGVTFKELVFEDKEIEKPAKEGHPSPGHPRCLGIKLSDDRKIVFPKRTASRNAMEDVVISTTGFVDTFIKMMPTDIRQAYHVPMGLPALSERRPQWKILFGLSGSAEELDITGADFYRLPNAALPSDEVDPATGAITLGMIGGKDTYDEEEDVIVVDFINAPTAESTAEKADAPKKPRRVKFYNGESWMKISFPSAKDPTFSERHGNVTTCVVTVEVDDDFVTFFDAKPKIFSTLKKSAESSDPAQRLMERVQKDLLDIYPQLEGKVAHCEIRGPFAQGLSHNPERFAAKGVRPDTTYPNLYVGGSDITIGDSFSGGVVAGWLTANAVMGYAAIDHMFLEKSITSDLERFIEPPDELEEEDVAVPYTPPIEPPIEESEQAAGEEVEAKKEQ